MSKNIVTRPVLLQGSDEMKGLLEHQKKIQSWLHNVNNKIYSLEESYLEETPLGNIVRGWEIDGKLLPLKTKGQEERERLFSFSSYQIWMDKKSNHEPAVEVAVGEKIIIQLSSSSSPLSSSLSSSPLSSSLSLSRLSSSLLSS
jgi:hypothetical protein